MLRNLRFSAVSPRTFAKNCIVSRFSSSFSPRMYHTTTPLLLSKCFTRRINFAWLSSSTCFDNRLSLCIGRSLSSTPTRLRYRGKWNKISGENTNASVNGKIAANSDGKLSVAVEMLMAKADQRQPFSYSQKLYSGVKSCEIDARLSELEHLAAIKIGDLDYAIELNNEDDTNSDWYGDVAELDSNVNNQLPAAHQPGKTVQLFGNPDPEILPSKVPCHGCGVHLHCVDSGIAGYVPSQIFVANGPEHLKNILCQRCYLLDKFNIAIDVAIKPMEFQAIAEQIIKTTPALLLIMVDLTDLPNSFFEEFAELHNEHRPVYIIGNKVDLLPRDDAFYLRRIKNSLIQLCSERGMAVQHAALISAKTGYGVENLISKLLTDWRLKGQLYILGCTNVGKSSLFNMLLSSDYSRIAARDVIRRAISSIWPGTTLSLLKFPIVNPKPIRLYERVERLKKLRSGEREEEKLRHQLLNETGHSKYATLMGFIGQTSPSLHKAALDKHIEKRHPTGFVAPSYSFDDSVQSNQNNTSQLSWFQDHIGRDAILDGLRLKVAPYDDSSYKFWCYDTPGIVNPDQVINYLNTDELLVLVNTKMIIPRTFRLKPLHVLFVSGLSRLDYIKGDNDIYCTVFAAESIPVYVSSFEESENFYRLNIGTPKLGVPLGDRDRLNLLPSLVDCEFTLRGIGWKESVADIVLSSVGWVAITTRLDSCVTLKAFTPGGHGCVLRSPSLLKYAVNSRGKRVRGTYSYHMRSPKFCSDR